jgi:phage/plasmid-associated DNA primase
MATIEQFLKEYEVPFESNTNWVLADGSKNGYTLKWNRPSEDVKDSNVSSKWINVFQKYCESPIWTLDCDDQEMGLDETIKRVTEAFGFTPPYTLSSTKKLPHFYLAVENCPITTDISQGIFKICKGDWIKVSVEERNAIVYENKELEILDWNDIKTHFTFEEKKKKKLIIKSKVEPSNAIKKNNINKSGMEELLFLIDPNKINYNDFVRVVIAYADEAGESGLESFLEWNSQYSSANMEADEKTYMSFVGKQNGVSVGTLRFIAKRENPKGYQEWCEKNITITFSLDLTTGAVADYFSKLNNDFIYTNGQLYHFNGVYWEKDDKNSSILNQYVDTNFFSDYWKKFQSWETNSLGKISEDDISKVRKMVLNIRNHKKRKEYIDDIIVKITNNKLEFDENPYLFAFTNAIYDFKEMKFVVPNPLDYISMTCGVTYNKDYDITLVNSLDKLICSIHSNENIRNYYLSALATGMLGIQIEKLIVCAGVGGNGKGLLSKLMMALLGDYGYSLKSTCLTVPISEGSNPELANCHKKRFILSSEPDSKKTLDVSVVKALTGDKTLNVRLNFSNNCKCILQNTQFIECNKKLFFSEVDDAIARRLETTPFSARFVDADKYDADDKTITGIINTEYDSDDWRKKYTQALFTILLRYVPNFLKSGLVSPKEIQLENKKYLEESDKILETIHTTIVKTDDKKDYVKIKSLYESYKNTDYFKNLTKKEKRDSSYKAFNEYLEKSMFFRKYVDIEPCNRTAILRNYKYILEENLDNECRIEKDL